MSKRTRRGQRKTDESLTKEVVSLEERQVPAVLDFRLLSGLEKPLPLRLLDKFSIFKGDASQAEYASPTELSPGTENDSGFSANGVVLDPHLAAQSLSEAVQGAYVRVQIPEILDWVIEYGPTPAVWLITPVAWYRLVTPAKEFAGTYQTCLQIQQICNALVRLLQVDRDVGLDQARKTMLSTMQSTISPSPTKGSGSLQKILSKHANVIVRHLARHLGRHAKSSRLIEDLQKLAGVSPMLNASPFHGRPLFEVEKQDTPANPSARPPPRQDASSNNMYTRLLRVWDFCQSFRQLLRLPPYPLARLQEEVGGTAQPPLSECPLWRDTHLSMLRILEGIDTAVLEPATLAGFGSAAELGPSDVYRPLLSVSWPELLRHRLSHCADDSAHPAHGATLRLKVQEYNSLEKADCLCLLEALIHALVDTEAFREYLHEDGPDTMRHLLPRGEPFGRDSSGGVYYRLGSRAGMDRLFVEIHQDEDRVEESAPEGVLGWYLVDDLQQLIEWLETGDSQELELAEDIYQAFCTQMEAHAAGEDSGLEVPDGYASAEASPASITVLKSDILAVFDSVRFWDKGTEWLQAQAAVKAELGKAQTGKELARLVWLVEHLSYTDLLKGTGWGRKRSWCRDALERSHTLAQVAVVVCEMAVHRRDPTELGFISIEEFRESLAQASQQPTFIPSVGKKAMLVASGYAAHIHQAQPPRDALSSPIPKHWKFVEPVLVKDVKFVRGSWQRPAWQGRFVPPSLGPAADDLLIACLLLERQGGSSAQSDPSSDEIDWDNFSFQWGFQQPVSGLPQSQLTAQPPQVPEISQQVQSTIPISLSADPPLANAADATDSVERDETGVGHGHAPGSLVIGEGFPEAAGSGPGRIANAEAVPSVQDKLSNGHLGEGKNDNSAVQPNHHTVLSAVVPITDMRKAESSPSHDKAPVRRQSERDGGPQEDLHGVLPEGRDLGRDSSSPRAVQKTEGIANGRLVDRESERGSLPGARAEPSAVGSAVQGPPGAASANMNPVVNPIMALLAAHSETGRHTATAGAQQDSSVASQTFPLQQGSKLSTNWMVQLGQQQQQSAQQSAPAYAQASSKGSIHSRVGGHAVNASLSGNSEASTNLRRSGRTRTEVPRPGYDPSAELLEPASSVATRSRRGASSDLYQLSHHGAPMAAQQGLKPQSLSQFVLAAAESTQEEDAEKGVSIKFWKKDRDLAAVNFYVRQNGGTSVEYLLTSELYNTGMQRRWTQGDLVKMPAFANLARAMAIPSMRWYSGTVWSSYNPPSELIHAPKGEQPRPTESADTAKPRSPDTGENSGVPGPEAWVQHPEPGMQPSIAHGHQLVDSKATLPTSIYAVPRQPGQLETRKETAAASSWAQKSEIPVPSHQASNPNKPRLSSLVPAHAAQGGWPMGGASYRAQPEGGLGGPLDPWKALVIRWDPGTPTAWPSRVSPWEVTEDVNGLARAANSKSFHPVANRLSVNNFRPLGHLGQVPGMPASSANLGSSLGSFPQKNPQALQSRPASFSALMNQVVTSAPGQRPAPVAFQPSNAAFQPQPSGAAFMPLPSHALPRPQAFQFRPLPNSAAPDSASNVFSSQSQIPAEMPGQSLGTSIASGPAPPNTLNSMVQNRPALAPGVHFHRPSATTGNPTQISHRNQAAQPIPSFDASNASWQEEVARRSRKRNVDEANDQGGGRAVAEGYRERWLAKRPRPSPGSWLSGFCSACEKCTTGLRSCMGPCLRAFHLECVGSDSKRVPLETPWFCPECDSGRMMCSLCGEFSGGIHDMSVQKCSLGSCGRFFHTKCAENHSLSQMFKNGCRFRCPQHYCAICEKSGDGKDMVKCIRCPNAFHAPCMAGKTVMTLHPHSRVVLCGEHFDEIEPPPYKAPQPPADVENASFAGKQVVSNKL